MARGPLSKASIVAVAIAVSCAVVDEQSARDGGPCVGPQCGALDAGRDHVQADVPLPDSPADQTPPLFNPLCGPGECVPGDDKPCNSGPGTGGAGGGTGGSSFVDASLDSGGAQQQNAGASEDAPDSAPRASPYDAGTGTPPAYGCNVVAEGGKPASKCTVAGSGQVTAPCATHADCAPGLGCIAPKGSSGTPQCRPYCCAGADVCAKGSYCATRPIHDALLEVPVCIPADGCVLNEPSCPTCKCKEGTACTVVKDDGTTTCLPPGEGRAGDKCPCAAGYVCSQSTETCLKICATGASTPDCGSGKCQTVAYMPDGFGVCGLGSVGDGG